MRDILFRGKRIDTEQFVEGYLVNSNQDIWWIAQNRYSFGSVFNEYSCDDTFIWNRVIPETIGQFTGLYDKNGKRIFEGDIVSCFGGTQIFVVEYCEERCGYFFDDCILSGGAEPAPECLGNLRSTIEVIGNIYDNPELLRKEENEDERN